VIEAENVSKSYFVKPFAPSEVDGRVSTSLDTNDRGEGTRTVIRDFSLRIQRGDRIGVVGAERRRQDDAAQAADRRNRAGRRIGDAGEDASGIVIDQQRKLMSPARTVRDVLADGGDWIDVRGQKKHIKATSRNSCSIRQSSMPGRRRCRAASARGFCWRASSLAVQPAGARRADQRPRPRDARPAAGSDRRLRGHRAARQPRPRLPRPDGDGHARARRIGQGRHRRRRLRRLGEEEKSSPERGGERKAAAEERWLEVAELAEELQRQAS
jgi:hypothetical protein